MATSFGKLSEAIGVLAPNHPPPLDSEDDEQDELEEEQLVQDEEEDDPYDTDLDCSEGETSLILSL
jgi:hypothetical protein